MVISIKDTGIGISKDKLEKLFELGEVYSTPGTQNEKGTGLGLHLCREMAEKLGGRIWAESNDGTGSTFSFYACRIDPPNTKHSLDSSFWFIFSYNLIQLNQP